MVRHWNITLTVVVNHVCIVSMSLHYNKLASSSLLWRIIENRSMKLWVTSEN